MVSILSWLQCVDKDHGFLANVQQAITWNNEGNPDSKPHVANMGLTWVLSAPGGLHVGLMNFTLGEVL